VTGPRTAGRAQWLKRSNLALIRSPGTKSLHGMPRQNCFLLPSSSLRSQPTGNFHNVTGVGRLSPAPPVCVGTVAAKKAIASPTSEFIRTFCDPILISLSLGKATNLSIRCKLVEVVVLGLNIRVEGGSRCEVHQPNVANCHAERIELVDGCGGYVPIRLCESAARFGSPVRAPAGRARWRE
jgi:hypothetical protein